MYRICIIIHHSNLPLTSSVQAENEFVADSDFEMSDDDIEDLPETSTAEEEATSSAVRKKRPHVQIEYEMEGEPKEKERLKL